MTPPTRGYRLLRDAVLSLSLTQDFVRPLYHWRTSRPHDYADSPLNSGTGAAGDPLPNLKLADGEHLLDRLGDGAMVLLSTEPRPDLAPVLARWTARGLKTAALALPALERLGLQAGHAWLLRPDQHLAARWTALDADALDAAIARALGGDHAC